MGIVINAVLAGVVNGSFSAHGIRGHPRGASSSFRVKDAIYSVRCLAIEATEQHESRVTHQPSSFKSSLFVSQRGRSSGLISGWIGPMGDTGASLSKLEHEHGGT